MDEKASLTITIDDRDPYGDVMLHLQSMLLFAFEHSGGMSEAEYNNLKRIEELVVSIDNRKV
jgi:hypothetical protein